MSKVIILAYALLTLTACMGSGGSGGSGGATITQLQSDYTPSVFMDSAAPTSEQATNASYEGNASATSTVATNGGSIAPGAVAKTGQSLDILVNNQLFQEFKNDAIKVYGVGTTKLLFMSDRPTHEAVNKAIDSGNNVFDHFENVKPGQVDFVNGKYGERLVGIMDYPSATLILSAANDQTSLQYASFGSWAIEGKFEGTVDGTQVTMRDMAYSPFYFDLSTTDYKKAPSVSNSEFTGTAVAMAYQDSPRGYENQKFLTGEAKIAIPNALNNASLNLNFGRFYDFGATLNINSGGDFTISGLNSVALHQGVTDPGIELSTNVSVYKGPGSDPLGSGQFYGVTSGAATEAAGTFEFQEYTTGGDSRHTHGIKGSFGVKQ